MRDLPSNLVESARAKRGWTRKGGGRQNDRLAQQRVEEWGGGASRDQKFDQEGGNGEGGGVVGGDVVRRPRAHGLGRLGCQRHFKAIPL